MQYCLLANVDSDSTLNLRYAALWCLKLNHNLRACTLCAVTRLFVHMWSINIEKISKKDLFKFNEILNEIDYNPKIGIRLIGDELADRGSKHNIVLSNTCQLHTTNFLLTSEVYFILRSIAAIYDPRWSQGLISISEFCYTSRRHGI